MVFDWPDTPDTAHFLRELEDLVEQEMLSLSDFQRMGRLACIVASRLGTSVGAVYELVGA